VGQVILASSNVSAGSQELSSSAEQLSQGSTEQAASTEEASASMEEMAQELDGDVPDGAAGRGRGQAQLLAGPVLEMRRREPAEMLRPQDLAVAP
ncbi:hypothetical protein MKK67_18510, partial [Methylobacterium sp. J-072]|nr:hypothetical protein [Methylobacterium sp. J-072]